jgi:hypothetical protein
LYTSKIENKNITTNEHKEMLLDTMMAC